MDQVPTSTNIILSREGEGTVGCLHAYLRGLLWRFVFRPVSASQITLGHVGSFASFEAPGGSASEASQITSSDLYPATWEA